MTTPQNPNLRPGEAGFVLPLVLIIVAIGAMVVIGLLGYASGLLRAGGEDADTLKELYAADAGITYVKRLLEQEFPHENISPIQVNGINVEMVVTAVETPGTAVPTPRPQAIDPELQEGHFGPHLVTLKSVPDGTMLDISWAFTQLTPTPTPALSYPSLAVLGGGTPIATTEPLTEVVPERKYWIDLPPRGRPPIELLGAKTYIVDFNTGTLEDLVSDSFTEDKDKCGKQTIAHFCLTTPAKDYIVVSTAGDTTVTAYLRQMPQWTLEYPGGINYTFSGAEVVTLSWKPYPPDE